VSIGLDEPYRVFISEDPIGLAGGINQFAYVRNRPLNNNDPLGLFEVTHNIWTDYAVYGANASEFQKERDFRHTAKFGKCFAKCMGGRLLAPVEIHLIGEGAKHLAEHYAYEKAGTILGSVIKYGSEAGSIIGWGVFTYEAYKCMRECGKEDDCPK
jgi:hypothetical protein